mgnify:CR=1 FL=1
MCMGPIHGDGEASVSEHLNYAVFLFPQAIEALGEPIKPYLRATPAGAHIVCSEIDASGALFEMTLVGKGPQGEPLELEIMVPTSMVKLVMSMHGEHEIGFV